MVELYSSYLAQEASDSCLFLCQLLRFFFCGLGVCLMALEGCCIGGVVHHYRLQQGHRMRQMLLSRLIIFQFYKSQRLYSYLIASTYESQHLEASVPATSSRYPPSNVSLSRVIYVCSHTQKHSHKHTIHHTFIPPSPTTTLSSLISPIHKPPPKPPPPQSPQSVRTPHKHPPSHPIPSHPIPK